MRASGSNIWSVTRVDQTLRSRFHSGLTHKTVRTLHNVLSYSLHLGRLGLHRLATNAHLQGDQWQEQHLEWARNLSYLSLQMLKIACWTLILFLYPPQKNFQVLLMSVALVSGALPLVCRVVTKDYKSKDGEILMKDDESMFLLSVSADALFEP